MLDIQKMTEKTREALAAAGAAAREYGHQEIRPIHLLSALAQQEGVPVETLTPMGRSYEAIVEAAGGRGVDLIVVGTYGKTGLTKILMGSSTERVIGLAGCAVMVVKGTGGQAATV